MRCQENDAGRDFYFSSEKFRPRESFTMAGAAASSRCIVKQLLRNTRDLLPAAAGLTDAYKVYSRRILMRHSGAAARFLAAGLLLAFIIFGAFRQAKGGVMGLFVFASLMLALVTILAQPKIRYMVPLIPVLVLGAGWYGARLRAKLDRRPWLGSLCIPLAILIFSNGASNWLYMTKVLVSDLSEGKARVLEAPDYIKSNYARIKQTTAGCRGIMALESTFLGAFTSVPLNRIYDIWEIPPFGDLNGPEYAGLIPERVDCLLISSELRRMLGEPMNAQTRYQNYIRPYRDKLRGLGAAKLDLGKFGEIVILRDH